MAQCDVTIEKGITSLEPSMTQFLQALNIGSKITKGSIEIINDVELLKEGQKIDASQAALLQKLDITPFEYGLIPKFVYDNGSLFQPAVLDIQDSQILANFQSCLKQTACISIELNMPTVASVPYSILLAFSNLLAVAADTEFTFASSVPAASGTTTSGSAAPAAQKEESEEDEEITAGPGLFDAGDDY